MILLFLILMIILPNIADAACDYSMFGSMATQITAMNYGTTVSCGSKYIYHPGKTYCGPTALTDATYDARHTPGQATVSSSITYKGTSFGCVSNLDSGWVKSGYYRVQVACTYANGNPGTTYEYHFNVPMFCKTCLCEETVDEYCVLRTISCVDGRPAAIEYTQCSDGVPSPSGQVCGSVAWASAFLAGVENQTYEYDGLITEVSCNCDKTYEDIMALCNQVTVGQDCGQPLICESDDDCDGVTNQNDLCPDTERGYEVNQFGCKIPEEEILDPLPPEEVPEPDMDDDGVPDDWDSCPSSVPGAVVNLNGCEIDNSDQPVDNPDGTPTGDNDNDNALLEGIISWLSGIKDDTGKIDDSLNDIERELERESTYEFDDRSEASKNDAQNALEGVISNFESEPDLTEHPILTDRLDLYGLLTSAILSNPISDIINGVDVSASGSCSMSVTLLGRPISLTMCGFESQLNAFGQVILMLVSFHSLFIIFRRS